MELATFWGVVEVLGHKRYAGQIGEQVVGGTSFVRVDVPATDREPAFTKLIGGASVYAISPTSEEVARRAASTFQSRPVEIYLGPLAERVTPQPLLTGDDYEPHQGGYYRDEDDE